MPWRRQYFAGVFCSGKESVDETKLEQLGEMLWYADMAYEGESERTLHERLTKKGGLHCTYL